MSLELKITIDDKISPALSEFIGMLDGDAIEDLNRAGAQVANESAKNYHREFEKNRGWINPALPTHGAGRSKSGFGNAITNAWNVETVTQDGFQIANDAPWYAFKVTGGTVTPKRAKALTIPLIPEAHNVRARDYPGKLFIPKGKSYLAEKVGGSEIRAVYALKKSQTFKPWKGALPDTEEMSERVLEFFSETILDALE